MKTYYFIKFCAGFFILILILFSCKKDSDIHLKELALPLDDDQSLPYHYYNWMSDISDNTYLSEVTIPGTHDSGADKHTSQMGWPEWHYVICQDFRLWNQLKLGVRWFDIRLKYKHSDDLPVHHANYYLHKHFDNLLDDASDFLKDHASEIVVFMIKQEGSSESDYHFGKAVYNKLKKKGLDHFYLLNKVPTVGEARGKIVIIRRFDNKLEHDFGMHFYWHNNTKGDSFSTGGINIYVQDHYSLHTVFTNTKYEEIKNCIRKAREGTDPKKFYLNFVSGERVPEETIWETADKINPKVESYLNSKSWHNCGIIMVNIAGGGDVSHGSRNCAQNLVKVILKKNF